LPFLAFGGPRKRPYQSVRTHPCQRPRQNDRRPNHDPAAFFGEAARPDDPQIKMAAHVETAI